MQGLLVILEKISFLKMIPSIPLFPCKLVKLLKINYTKLWNFDVAQIWNIAQCRD